MKVREALSLTLENSLSHAQTHNRPEEAVNHREQWPDLAGIIGDSFNISQPLLFLPVPALAAGKAKTASLSLSVLQPTGARLPKFKPDSVSSYLSKVWFSWVLDCIVFSLATLIPRCSIESFHGIGVHGVLLDTWHLKFRVFIHKLLSQWVWFTNFVIY